jgi:hypothetical protein
MGISYGLDRNFGAVTNTGRTQVTTAGINQTGLVYNIDFGVTGSYPGSGTTVTDLKNAVTGAFSGTGVYSTSNYGGWSSDGSAANYLNFGTIALASPLTVTTDFTIEQIFKPTGYQASTYFGLTNQLLAKGSASTYNYAVQASTDTTYSFIKRTGAEGLQYHTFTIPSMLNRVNVVTITVTGSVVSCYHNGVFQSSTALVGAACAGVNGDPFLVGGSGTTYVNLIGVYYAGRIYNRALSATEILKNFNAVSPRYNI